MENEKLYFWATATGNSVTVWPIICEKDFVKAQHKELEGITSL